MKRAGLGLSAAFLVGFALWLASQPAADASDQRSGQKGGTATERESAPHGARWGQHTPGGRADAKDAANGPRAGTPAVRPSVATRADASVEFPRIHATAWIDPHASVIGDVVIGERSFVAPQAAIRADVGPPIAVGAASNIQDGAVLRAAPPAPESPLAATYTVDGHPYSIFLGPKVSIAAHATIMGPVWIEERVFVGPNVFVHRTHIGHGSVVEPGATVIGVVIGEERYVHAGAVVTRQDVADELPRITYSYGLRDVNRHEVGTHVALAEAYTGTAALPPASAR